MGLAMGLARTRRAAAPAHCCWWSSIAAGAAVGAGGGWTLAPQMAASKYPAANDAGICKLFRVLPQ
jgi:hypothetical protein